MRVLIVTNMWPPASAPALGSFVRDQVDALRELDGVEIEVFAFSPGGYARAARELRRRHRRGERFDLVHAHFGLTAWPAFAVRKTPHVVTLHGTDLRHPRSKRITRAALPFVDLVAAVSAELAREVPGGARLLTLGRVHPFEVPLYVNAASAVLVPSDHEGFGLGVLEALACDVPVLATPTGVHPAALDAVPGTLCAPYDRDAWRAALRPHLDDPDPRITGRA